MARSRSYLDDLLVDGRSTFTTQEFAKSLRLSEIATTHSLLRLRKKKLIASPIRSFHVILEPVDRIRGCKAPDEFIDYLMTFLREPYYVALLTAAERHGAAHQRPQVYQVMVKTKRRPVTCGRVRIVFIFKSNLESIPVQKYKVRSGYLNLATPEVTAFDLVAYHLKAVGFDNVATVIIELAEVLSADTLKETAKCFPITVGQRLGFILDELNFPILSNSLHLGIRNRIRRATPLTASTSTKGARTNKKWRVVVNTVLDPDL